MYLYSKLWEVRRNILKLEEYAWNKHEQKLKSERSEFKYTASKIKIYHYTKGFMHAKTVIVDSEVFTIGTANFDIRSLQLNYELN
ncbi:MAG: hypothetical protein GX817_06275, partial [Elusimicrobia bacterium]|nr:hypothetical protein [Elusimicrobiota bacterium]